MDLIEQNKLSSDNISRHPWEKVRLKIALHFIKKHKAKVIVDFGSGDAYISRSIALQFPGAKVFAIDINYTDQYILSAPQTSNLTLLKKIEDLNLKNGKCDFVLVMDVLEHIAAPAEVLKLLLKHTAVTSETNVLVTVPAYQMLFNKHDTLLGHHKRYRRTELVALLRKSGLHVHFSGYLFPSLLPIRLLEKMSILDISPGDVSKWKGGKGITSIISGFFWLEFRIAYFLSLFNFHLPGLTCYCLCRPSL